MSNVFKTNNWRNYCNSRHLKRLVWQVMTINNMQFVTQYKISFAKHSWPEKKKIIVNLFLSFTVIYCNKNLIAFQNVKINERSECIHQFLHFKLKF